MKWLYFPMFDHHITVSEHTAEELIHASRGHKVRRGIWVAPMGVDCDRFTSQRRTPAIRKGLLELVRGGEDSTILFYAGRLVPEKNLSLLIETVARLDPATSRLAVAGTGILFDSLQRECVSRGLRNVTFLGHIADRETLANYYANADIFIHPNPREPFGIAPLDGDVLGPGACGAQCRWGNLLRRCFECLAGGSNSGRGSPRQWPQPAPMLPSAPAGPLLRGEQRSGTGGRMLQPGFYSFTANSTL